MLSSTLQNCIRVTAVDVLSCARGTLKCNFISRVAVTIGSTRRRASGRALWSKSWCASRCAGKCSGQTAWSWQRAVKRLPPLAPSTMVECRPICTAGVDSTSRTPITLSTHCPQCSTQQPLESRCWFRKGGCLRERHTVYCCQKRGSNIHHRLPCRHPSTKVKLQNAMVRELTR